MGGREACRALRALDPEVRAVVMSGHSDDQDAGVFAARLRARSPAVRPRVLLDFFRRPERLELLALQEFRPRTHAGQNQLV